MGRRSRDGVGRNTARIMAPVVFWAFAEMMYSGFAGVLGGVAVGAAIIMVLIGACFVPRAIRTIRELL